MSLLETLLTIESELVQKLVLQEIKIYCKDFKHEQVKRLINILFRIEDVNDRAINHLKAEILLQLVLRVAPPQESVKTLELSLASITNSPSIIIAQLEKETILSKLS